MGDERHNRKGAERLSEEDVQEVEERLRLRAPVVYQVVREEGEEELARPAASLWWSGVAAGIAISMSVVAQGLLRHHLPDTGWRPLLASLGYSVGFVIVVVGRLQLFTENTITAVLPLLAETTRRNLLLTARLWGIVFAANLTGTLVFALAATFAGIFPADQTEPYLEIARHFMEKSPLEMAAHGIPAGFLIAAMVWMIPSAEGYEFWVITVLTYFIALAGLAHVVVGSAEAFLLLLHGEIGLWQTVGGFLVPTFLGNVIGGTGLFTLLAYAQVQKEL